MKWKRKDMGLMNNEIRKYVDYYLRRNKKLLIFIYAVLFVVMPFFVLNQGSYADINTARATILMVYFIGGGVLAFLVPILNFRFMYEKRSCDLYFSLPIKKGKLFDIQFLLGLIVIFGPLLSNVVLTLLIMIMKSIPVLELLLLLLVILIGLSFFIIVQYTIFVFFLQKCNNRLDAIFINLSYLVLPGIFVGALMIFYGNQVSNLLVSHEGMTTSFFQFFSQDIISLISVPYTAVVYILEVMNDLFEGWGNTLPFFSWWMIPYWAMIMGVCYYFGRKSFIERREEYAENRSTSRFTYPFVILAITFLLLLMVGVSFHIVIIIIFMMYIGMLFFANRKIKLRLKHLLIFCVMYASVLGCSSLFQATKGFGVVQEVFDISEVAFVEMGYYFPEQREYTIDNKVEKYTGLLISMDETDDLKDALQLQDAFVAQANTQEYKEEFVLVRFEYKLKDGSTHSRAYYSRTTKLDQMIDERIDTIVRNEETLNDFIMYNDLKFMDR